MGQPAQPLIAILDSGLYSGHPHVADLKHRGFQLAEGPGGVPMRLPDYSDCTGHGTAIAAAIHRMLPEAELLIIRLLDEDLRCTSARVADGIRAAVAEGATLINLSLGSGDPDSAALFEAAVAEAAASGAFCIAAAHPRGRPLWPADLPSVLSAATHRSCPLGDLFELEGPLPRFVAHGFPRPIEGRPPRDNLFGPSFAAVHLTGRVAALLAESPELQFKDLVTQLRAGSSGRTTLQP